MLGSFISNVMLIILFYFMNKSNGLVIFGFLGFGHIFLDRKRRGILLLLGFFLFHIIISMTYLYTGTKILGSITIIRLLIVIMSAYWAYRTARGEKLDFEWGKRISKKEEIPDLGIIRY